jgi:hypothetical protein
MSTRVPREYEVAVQSRTGHERIHRYESAEPLEPGQVLRLEGRYWLVERVDAGEPARALAKPARYRIRLRHPDGREEPGSFRRYRPDAPRAGHTFTTIEDGQPISWAVAEGGLAHDPEGDPYLDLVAERDYAEREDGDLADHELEHALATGAQRLPAAAVAKLSRAEDAGLLSELVALEPGEPPDWDEAQRYIDALVFEEIEDDLFELRGVNLSRDPQDTWLVTVQERLCADLESFRSDIEGDHDQIEEWDFLDGSVFVAVGTFDDEAEPTNGFGWLCRLVDAGVLAAAGFRRVRKPELQVSE